jgi:hypothetical protein
MSEQRGGIVGQLLVGERAIDIGGVPVPLHLGNDDLSRLGEKRHQLPQRLGRHEGAVQQEQRPALPMNLVIHLEAIDRRVPCRWHGRFPSIAMRRSRRRASAPGREVVVRRRLDSTARLRPPIRPAGAR